MYSAQLLRIIRNKEREQFQKIKKIENINKNLNLLEDILDTKDFTFKKFNNSGDSGSLLIATAKNNKDERYIIKHEYYDCACNEYMYSKIGNEMGINISPVKLFLVTDKKKLFKSDFVCGIRYYENGKSVGYKYIEENKEDIYNWKDYFKFLGMEDLFFEGDGIEVIKENNLIYRIDTTDAFSLSHMFISYLGYEGKFKDIDIKSFAENNIIKLANIDEKNVISNWNITKSTFIKYYNIDYLQYYLEPFQSFLEIDYNKIEKWCDNICYFYPNIIGEYYKIYFKNIKKCVEHFFK